MRISAALFTETFLDGEGVASACSKVARVLSSLGELAQLWLHTFHGPWLKLLPRFRFWFSVSSEMGGDGQAPEAPRHYDLTKHPPLCWALALLYPEPKNGSQCMSLP